MGRPTVLKVDIVADAKGVKPGVADADRQLSQLGSRTSKVGAVMGAGLAVAGVAALKFGKDSVDAYVAAEQSSARLDEALRRFPATHDVTRASLDKLNSSLAAKTRFDDDATASGQAVLAQFKLTGTQITTLTPLLQDYAAKTGKDLPAAADVLGKALMGKGKALSEVGIKFKDAGSTGANFEQIVTGLRSQVGGFAEDEGKTAAGQAAILGNRFGEVQEKVGGKLTPALTALGGGLVKTIDFMDRNSKVIVPLVAVIGALAAGIYLVNTAAKVYTATQAALNVVMSLNPIGLVVLAIAALVAGVVLAYKHSETFRNGVSVLWEWLKKFAGFTPLGALIKNFDTVKGAATALLDIVKDVAGWLGNLKFPSPPGWLTGGLGKLGGLLGGAVGPLAGRAGALVGPGAGLDGMTRDLATASVGDGWAGILPGGGSSGGGGLVVDRRVTNHFRIDGALDPVGVAQTIRQLLADQARREGLPE